jgi:uncharacterized protein with PIN domain
MAIAVRFRCYAELNDFLAPGLRGHEFERSLAAAPATVKHAVEALGVPHTEVELVLVNGRSVGFDARLADGDRVAVYPVFEALDVAPLLRLRERPLRTTRFGADAHLGALARLLRLLGFDTRCDPALDDDAIVRAARDEHRIVLTRDRGLLMRRELTHGCYVHALRPREQARELLDRLELHASARPFRLCLRCNAPLEPVAKASVEALLPARVRERHECFTRCPACRRVYWEGTHWQRMRAAVDALLAADRPRLRPASAGPPAPPPA